MLYGSDTWCLRENEMAILKRTKITMIGVMCEVKLIEKRSPELYRSLLGLKHTILARTSGVRWYGHVLRRDSNACFEKR